MCCNNCSKHARAAGVCNKGLVQVWFSTAAIFTHHQQSMNLFRIWFFHVLFVALSLPCRALLSYPSLCLFALSTDLFLLHVPYSGGYFSFVLLLAGCVLPVEEYWKGGSQIRQIFTFRSFPQTKRYLFYLFSFICSFYCLLKHIVFIF